MRLSHTSTSTFSSCQRKFELTYVHNLKARRSTNDRNLILGSAFHAGLNAALCSGSVVKALRIAIDAAHAVIEAEMGKPAMIYSEEARGMVEDVDYPFMLNEMYNHVENMLSFYYPRMGLFSRYFPVTLSDLKLQGGHPDEVISEYKFSVDYEGHSITGTVDAVFFDKDTNEYVLVDWKTRSTMPMDMYATLDNQLHLYAAALNRMGASIDRVIMWQFKTKLPSPASISKVNGKPNTGAASYDTTWEMWKETLPSNINPADYEEVMKPKLKEHADFEHKLESIVTSTSSKLALDNMMIAASSIENAEKKGYHAALGSFACRFCPFARLCGDVLRYGGDATPLIEAYYERRDGEPVFDEPEF